jgi:hypothetical protein
VIGAIVLVVLLVVVVPVAMCMSGAVAAAILGWSLKESVERDHEGSELVELNA